MHRSTFLKSLSGTGLIVTALPLLSFRNQEGEKMDAKIVKEFVIASHKDFEKVKSLLAESPNLLNTAHDWGYGDFETGLGAASHMGNKDITQYLLDNGAQANIFTACLFGKLDIVKPMLTAFPHTLNAKGPHGFTLLHHAIKGEDEALEVKEYLTSLGAKESKIPLY